MEQTYTVGMNKLIYGIVALLIIVGGVYFFMGEPAEAPLPGDAVASEVKIGLSLGTNREERWQKDVADFTERANALGASVEVKYSGEDAALQLSQAENMIIQGVKVLVVIANDAVKAGAIVEKAHAAGVKVVAYDRMISASDVDLFTTYDSREIGRLQAEAIVKRAPKGTYVYIGGSPTDNNATLLKEGSMKVLQPLIDKGDITLALSTFSKDWRPEEAYAAMKAYLASGKKVDAVVAANDGTAGGVVRALTEKGLAGKVPVSGQDADLAASQRIVAGTQAVTIYKPFQALAYEAAEAAVALANGKTPKINGKLNNGKIDVASYFLTPTSVTKENIDATVIADGFHTRLEVYGKGQ
jgi:D-xylose transport system substrate-binding protein